MGLSSDSLSLSLSLVSVGVRGYTREGAWWVCVRMLESAGVRRRSLAIRQLAVLNEIVSRVHLNSRGCFWPSALDLSL